MKSVKLLALTVLLMAYMNGYAQVQQKPVDKNVKTKFEVSGVCEMCKNRIEEAALFTKGVKFASWDKKTQMLEVVYNNKKTSEQKIHQQIAAVGHNTSEVKAKPEDYQKLPDCCKYLEVKVH